MMSDSLEETYRLEALSSIAGAALRPQTAIQCSCGEHLEERLAAVEQAITQWRGEGYSRWLYCAAGVVTGYLGARCARAR
jgi:hypothetical protein